MNKPLISVIVPIYNVEKYLPACLDSIISQSYKNLEIILVDDGSTDRSYKICQEYAKKDKRIKLFKQKNAGPGPARNFGLAKSAGEWLSFVDSDDVLEKDFYKKLSSHIEEDLNIICSNVEIIFETTNQQTACEKAFYSHKFSGKLSVNHKLKTEINTELWNKIFRRKIFDFYQIDFKSGAFEDGDILFKILAVSDNVYFDNTAIYYYRRRINSIVESLSHGKTTVNCNAVTGVTEQLYRLYDFYKRNHLLEKNWKFLLFLLHRNYLFVVSQISVTERITLDNLVSNFLEDRVPDKIINKYGLDVSLLYKLKLVNVLKPFHSRNIKDNIKIAVCYHKPSLLPEKGNSVFFPIHLGRSLMNNISKDGSLKQADIQWLYNNMIGDNTGDNISLENRKYCELTAIYWAWKNYDSIGSPEYFGLCHYRRIFNLYGVNITADAYWAKVWNSPENAYTQYKNYHRTNEFDLALDVIRTDYPDYIAVATRYCQSHELHLLNMFIMKKELFFRYATWLFDILSKVEKNIDYTYRSYQSLRALGYLAERLQDIFMLKLKEEGFDVRELPLIQPNEKELSVKPYLFHDFKKDHIIVTSCDNNYALYAGVMIQSIIQNISKKENYVIYILDAGISLENREKIKSLEIQNVHIDFINMNYYTNKYAHLFKVNTHFSLATYYRFFIPQLFSSCNRVIYLDPDMVITKDISELFHIDLQGHAIGACRDVEAERKTLSDKKLQDYFYNGLQIKNIHNYFQAGVMICDIKKMIQINFTEQCLNKLKKLGAPMWVDQDVMNSVMNGNICFIKPHWNFCFFLLLNNSFILNRLDYHIYNQMKEIEQKPYIIHFCGGAKPWDNPTLPLADIWWQYARQTPFYEEIIWKNISNPSRAMPSNAINNRAFDSERYVRDVILFPFIYMSYIRCRLLKHFTWGRKKTHYNAKKQAYHKRIQQVRAWLKGR